jgi:hypothetical protein
MNLCNCCYLNSTRIMCVLRRAYYAWWRVSEATSCRLWRDRYNLQGAGFGALQVVSEPRFCRYPRVQSADRITLPTDVEFSVKTILIKMSWIDLSSSVFFSLSMCFSPLIFASFESSLLPTSSSFRFPRGWTISSLLSQLDRSSEVHHHRCEQEFLVSGVEKKPLVSGVAKFNMTREDPIA